MVELSLAHTISTLSKSANVTKWISTQKLLSFLTQHLLPSQNVDPYATLTWLNKIANLVEFLF